MTTTNRIIAIISSDFQDNELFGCGIFQNAMLFYELFNSINGLKAFFFLPNRNGGLISNSGEYDSYVFADLDDLPFKIDVCIEVTTLIDIDTKKKLKTHHDNVKLVTLRLGNFIAHDIDSIIYNVDHGMQMDAWGIDAVWVSPHYEHAKEYISTLYHLDEAKTAIAPYVWDSRFLDIRIEKTGRSYDELKFSPSDPKKVAVLEPNLNYTKNALTPILILEEAYRVDPNSYEAAYINWTEKEGAAQHYFLETFGRNCEIVRAETNKLYLIGRYEFPTIVGDGVKYIVSHQRDNALNYIYLEAAYLGLPLIHNSEFLSDFGYYYEGYNTKQGASALLKALSEHADPETLANYNMYSQDLIKQYSIYNPSVKTGYRELIDKLFEAE